MVSNSKDFPYTSIDASPVKSFFVSMLTRDIKLEDAILDLLDNCVDGILRSNQAGKGDKPYKGFWAEIDFSENTFSISDNCGGIPWQLSSYAFKMGRDNDRKDSVPGTVGVYGIGMKRAIFKMGRRCLISTQNHEHRYEVDFTPEWLDDKNWGKIPVHAVAKQKKQDGTTIVVGDLYSGIASRFGDDAESFQAELERLISTHYAFIIDKGFQVRVNGDIVIPKPIRLIFTDGGGANIKPFIFEASEDGVDVFLAIGFTRPIPSQEEVLEEQETTQYSTQNAGWTILCNDRAVLYCDRTELTGWGEAGVPRYHTQFIAISGIVEFRASDASKLPSTTTKRGIDASSKLYLQVKNKMREGMLIFTDYTNKWKGKADESKKHIDAGKPISLGEIKQRAKALDMRTTSTSVGSGKQFKPPVPMPKKLDPKTRRITFSKSIKDVERIALHLFDDAKTKPSEVGEKCFDLILEETR